MASPATRTTASRPFCSVEAIVQSVRKLLDGHNESTIWDEVWQTDPHQVAVLWCSTLFRITASSIRPGQSIGVINMCHKAATPSVIYCCRCWTQMW